MPTQHPAFPLSARATAQAATLVCSLCAGLLPWQAQAAQPMAASNPSADVDAIVRELTPPKPALPKLIPEAQTPAKAEAKPDAKPDAKPSVPQPEVDTHFTFQRLAVKGVGSLSAEQLAQLSAPHVGKTIGEAELGAMLQGLRQMLDAAGQPLAQIGLPRIDLAQGEVTVPVVEATLGRVTVPTGADSPVTEERVRGLLAWFKVEEGQRLNVQALDRVLFALNDMPGVQAKGKLVPTGDEGAYNLTIQTASRRSWDASVSADNNGLGPVGRVRLGATGRLNNPFGLGDNLDVQALVSDTGGVKLARAGYELPLGYTPARVAFAASTLAYDLGGQFDTLGASGTANLVEASVSYPVIRTRGRTLLARVGLDQKRFSDKLELYGGETTERKLQGLNASVNWESRDSWGGGGFWGAGGTLRLGHLSYGNTPLGTLVEAGNYRKLEAQVSRLQALFDPLSLFVSASFQQASRTLDPAEKVGLGGARGVRAYAQSEAPADDARLVSAELRWWVSPTVTVFALTDWAHGRLDHNTAGRSVTLRGSGLGLSASVYDWFTVRGTLAWRHSGAGAADPGHDKPRLAVQLQHSF
ncbi:MAG: hypothetical protein RI907_2714 [Pseudomonadota bacterium]|jgi:hemolysin activation/secretion protein